jgi:preprotein translocase subunit SecG
MDDFENFLYILTYILFVCLFIRSLVALYMGRWKTLELVLKLYLY